MLWLLSGWNITPACRHATATMSPWWLNTEQVLAQGGSCWSLGSFFLFFVLEYLMQNLCGYYTLEHHLICLPFFHSIMTAFGTMLHLHQHCMFSKAERFCYTYCNMCICNRIPASMKRASLFSFDFLRFLFIPIPTTLG